MLEENLSLDENYFKEKADYVVFKEFLATLDDIKPVYIERSEFNKKQGEIVEKDGKSYNLYLPLDLKLYELPSIIYQINKLSFGDNLPKFTSINELKIKLVILLNSLFNQLKQEAKLDTKYKKAINKTLKIYESLFGIEETSKLNDKNYREQIINNGEKEKFLKYKKEILKITTKENLEGLEKEISELLGKEFKNHFLETFFENGINKLRLGLSIITQQEQLKIKEKRTRFERIVYLTETKDLERKEILMRESLQIDKYKNELRELRKKGKQDDINKKELEITKNILSEINKYPYQRTLKSFGYKPIAIRNQNEIFCVGYSLLGHAFLSELGIKHYGLDIQGHSALEVIIGGQSYYFDSAMKNSRLFKMKWDKSGSKYKIFIFGNNKDVGLRENPEKGLLNDILIDLAFELDTSLGENIYLKILRNNPNNVDGLFGLAFFYREGNYKKAIALSKKILKINPYYIGIYNFIGNILYNLGKKGEAQEYWELEIKNCNKLIKKELNTIQAYFAIADCLKNLGRKEEAIKIYNKILIEDSGNLKAYFNLGNLLEESNKYEEAIEFYKKILIEDPNDTTCLYKIGNIFYKQKKYTDAINIYKQIIEKGKDTINAYFLIGKILYKEKRWEEALSFYQKVLEENHKDLNTKLNIINIYFNLGKEKEAYLLVEDVVEENKETNPNIYNILGNNLYGNYQYKEAIRFYKRDLNINPDNYRSISYIGNSLYALGKYREAIDFYKKVLIIKPDNQYSYYNIGISLKNLGFNNESEIFLYIEKKIIGEKTDINIDYLIGRQEAYILNKNIQNGNFKEIRDYVFWFLEI